MFKNEKNLRILHLVLLSLSLVVAVYIVNYYLQAVGLEELRQLPLDVYICVGIFVALQLIKRFVFKRMFWFDWLYYFGLIAILLPALLKFEQGAWLQDVADFGSMFLVVSPLAGLITLLLKKEESV